MASVVSAKPTSRSTVSANSAAPRGPCRIWPSMKRGLTARARTTRRDGLAERARARAGRIGGVERDQVGAAAERGKCGREAADEGDVGRAFEDVAAGIVAGVDQQFGLDSRSREGAGRGLAVAVGAAEGVRGGVHEGAADLFARRPICRSPAAPRCRRRRCRATMPKTRRGGLPVVAQRFGERVVAVGLVARGDRADRRVDQRDLRREHVAEQAGDAEGHVDARPAERGRRQHLDAGDAAGRGVPLRAAAHQRQALRDLLAAGPQAGAAPQVDHQRARPVAMVLRVAAQHLVGRGLAELERGRRRHGARIGGEQVAAGRQHVAAPARRRAGRAGRDVAAVERGEQRRALRLRRSAGAAGRLSSGAARPIDVQPVLDGEILEVAEPGVDPAAAPCPDPRRRVTPASSRKPGLAARSRRSASPAGRGGGGRARRPAHIRRPAAPASAGSRRGRRRRAAAAGGRW